MRCGQADKLYYQTGVAGSRGSLERVSRSVYVCVRGGVGSGGGRSAGSPEGIDPPRARSSEHLQAAGERLRHASPSRAYGQCGVERLWSTREGLATMHGEGAPHPA